MTNIEWTEKTWNPIVGCSIVSPGCTNCYAMKMAARIEAIDDAGFRKAIAHAVGSSPWAGDAADENRIRAEMNNGRVPSHYAGTTQRVKGNVVWTGKVARAPDNILTAPLRRKKPTMYFVNSMGDLFHESIPDEWILRVLDVIRSTGHDGGSNCGTIRHLDRSVGQHIYQVLTKRSARMREFMRRLAWDGERLHLRDSDDRARVILRNLWLGVSAERQTEAEERIPDLLATPAAVRFVSAEPLLGPVDFRNLKPRGQLTHDATRPFAVFGGKTGPGLDWIIVGGESGPGARPMHPDWARSIRDQCVAANVPFFFKQWGEFHPAEDHDPKLCKVDTPEAIHVSGEREYRPAEQFRLIGERDNGWVGMCKIGKKPAGRLLDGREWSEMPKAGQINEVVA